MLDVDVLLRPWWDALLTATGPLTLVDAHTHIGANDPDGVKQTPEALLAQLEHADARAAVFPMHEPDGYPAANDVAMEVASSSDGRLVAFCRVNPRADAEAGAVAEARRCLDAGARGIKLHPRAERFTLAEPAVHGLVELAHERRVPVLIHAGRGIPALGEDTVRLATEFPDARLILAHAAVSDLNWLWRVLPDHPNVFIDTAWWNASDLLTLFTLVPPGQIVWASDSPYGLPLTSAVMHMRCAVQAGLGHAALRSIAGEQMSRLLAGEDPQPAGDPPLAPRALDLHLERVYTHLISAVGRLFAEGDPAEPVSLARLACDLAADSVHADVHAGVLALLDLADQHRDEPPGPGQRFPPAARLLLTAVVVARTPDAPVPGLPVSVAG